jgi:hypothetical protein
VNLFKRALLERESRGPPMAALAALAAVALFLFAQPAAAVTVDHFVDGAFNISISASGPDVTSLNSGSMIGGYRYTDLSWTSGTPTSYSESARVVTGGTVLIWEEGDSIKGKLSILYNANGGGLGSGSGVDVTDGGAALQWLFACPVGGGDASTFDTTITAITTTGTEKWTGTFSGYGTFAMLFASGSVVSGTPDLTKVTSIQYMFDSAKGGVGGVGGGDYSFDLLGTGTIPEPVTMCGMLLGITGLVRYTRRRRAA